MGQLFILLLRILFPFDKVGRSRELMRGFLQMVMGWVMDPLQLADFEQDDKFRAWLEGYIAALEHNLQVLVWERAREMMGLRFIYVRRQSNPKFRRAKDMRQLLRRLTQLARNFHNLDKLAARSAARMQRDHDADPLGLAAAHQAICVVAANSPLQFSARFASTSALHWGRWIGASSRRDGGGCAFTRGCLRTRGPPHPPRSPIPDRPSPQKPGF
jgi:hypothetical protein